MLLHIISSRVWCDWMLSCPCWYSEWQHPVKQIVCTLARLTVIRKSTLIWRCSIEKTYCPAASNENRYRLLLYFVSIWLHIRDVSLKLTPVQLFGRSSPRKAAALQSGLQVFRLQTGQHHTAGPVISLLSHNPSMQRQWNSLGSKGFWNLEDRSAFWNHFSFVIIF